MAQGNAKKIGLDHGDLVGKDDNDHPQYLLKDEISSADLDEDVNGFTNTSYATLDALSTVSFSAGVSVTVTTGTSALVIVSANAMNQVSAGQCLLGYSISGATTKAATGSSGVRCTPGPLASYSQILVETGLTAGSNTFELEARVTSDEARIIRPSITVIPL